jgi:hypothetical protein
MMAVAMLWFFVMLVAARMVTVAIALAVAVMVAGV